MKCLMLFLVIFLLNSCNGDDAYYDPHRQYDYGSISALKNGVPWTAEIHGADNNGQWDYFGIDINKYNEQGYRREGLGFGKYDKAIGSYEIKKLCYGCVTTGNYSSISDDGDVICDAYDVLESEDNTLTITEYNSSTKEFAGSFKVTFLIQAPVDKCDPNAPDTIRFTNGVFQSKITR